MGFSIKQADNAFERGHYPDDAIFFFDFDGVLTTQCEEKVFRLPEKEMERRRLVELANLVGIDHDLYPHTPNLRHIVYQIMAYETTPEPHTEAVRFARNLDDLGDPYFIITARSATGAVQRMLKFLERYCLNPQETFCLGGMSKARMLETLRGFWPERRFVFFEDSQYNIDDCLAIGDPLLDVVKIEWPACTDNAEKLRAHHLGVK